MKKNLSALSAPVSAPSARSAVGKAISALSARSGGCGFCAHRAECRSGNAFLFNFCGTAYTPDIDRITAAVRLANRVHKFSREWNVWDYRDALDAAGGVAAMLEDDADLLLTGDRSIEEWLEECIEEQTADSENGLDDYDYMIKKADRLLRDVRRFCGSVR